MKVFSMVYRSPYRGVRPKQGEGPAQLLPRSRSREHLCLILIYFVYPLAKCVLRYQKSLRELIRVLHLV